MKPRSKPTLWPTRSASPANVEELLGRVLGRRGALDVLVGDAVDLVADDRAARVDEGRPLVGDLAALDLDGADLDEIGHLGVAAGRLDVDDDELALAPRPRRRSRGPTRCRARCTGCAWPCRRASWSSSWRSMIGWSERWPNRIASAMTSSVRSLAPASTIMIASRVPETIRSSSESSSWRSVGLTTNSSSMRPIADGRDRAEERDLADREGRRRGDRAEDVGVVLLVGREDRDDALDVVLVALGEQRPDRPVREAGGEDGRLGRARLALDEAAGDLAGRVHPLLEVDGEREEVEPGSGLGAVGGAQDERVAVADRDRTASEACDLAGLDGQRATTELRLESVRHGVKDLLSRGEERADGLGNRERLAPDTTRPRIPRGPR